MDIQQYKETLTQWATGVCVLTTILDGVPRGITVSSFSSLSIDPLLVMVCLGNKLTSHPMVMQSRIFAINILNSNQVEWGKRFAGMIPETQDRFAGIEYTTAETGSPILPDVIGWLDCRVYETFPAGDHTIVAGEVLAAQAIGGKEPLLYHRRGWGTFASFAPQKSLKHVVMFKLKEATPENAALLTSALNSLKGKVPQIRELEVGANILPSERAYDVALITRFDSLDDMRAYQTHPEHVKVLEEVIRPLSASIVATDYEI